MKAKLLFLMLLITFCAVAQTPRIIGLKSNAGNIDVVRWSLGDTDFESITENVSQNVVVGSSFYDDFDKNFFYKSTQPNKLIKYDVNTSELFLSDIFTDNALYETQIDIQNGDYYVLKLIGGELELHQTNANLDSLAFLGSYDPLTTQTPYLFRSSTYDSNNKVLYFIRLDNGDKVLYKTDLDQDNFEYTTISLDDFPLSGNVFLGYAVQTDELYCAFFTGNFLDQTTLFNAGKIDIQSGEYEEIMTLDNLNLFINFNVVFDQQSNSFVILGADFDYNRKIYWINLDEETSVLYDLPDANILELKCDNSIFAAQFYEPLAIDDFAKENTIIYPNPAKDKISINADEAFNYAIYTNLGQQVMTGKHLGQHQTIDIDNLKPGIYYMVIASENQETIKIIKQ